MNQEKSISLKRKPSVIISSIMLSLFIFSCGGPSGNSTKIDIEEIGQQLLVLDDNVQKEIAKSPLDARGEEKIVPRTINDDGSLRVVAGHDWTSGFYPGVMWYMYELTGDPEWKGKAVRYTSKLTKEMYNGSNHDVGFRMYCSFGNGLRLIEDEIYVPVLVQSAKTLIARYSETVRSIKSWDFNEEVWQFPVIVDNMMNLELLFWASEETGDPIYRDIAIQHALTTKKNHYRSDYSSVHVVDYDTITGAVRQKNTHQGYADESSWARGQAWGLYGFTMTYRCTKDKQFLEQAEKIAGFLLNHPRLPEDLVPYWDFDAPGIPNEERDVSAAAIIASALYELSTYTENGGELKEKADQILESLGSVYASPAGENYGFILAHSVGNKHGNSEVDVPLNYADYYFLEALVRQERLAHNKPVV